MHFCMRIAKIRKCLQIMTEIHVALVCGIQPNRTSLLTVTEMAAFYDILMRVVSCCFFQMNHGKILFEIRTIYNLRE